MELPGLELMTMEVFHSMPDAIPLCYRAYTMKAGKNKNYISSWRYFVLYGVVSYGVVSCCMVLCRFVSIGQST